MADPRDLFRAAAGSDASPDLAAITRRGQSLRRRRRALLGGTAGVAVLGLASVAALTLGGSARDSVVQPATPSVSAAASPTTAPLVSPAPSSNATTGPAGMVTLDVYLIPDHTSADCRRVQRVPRTVPATRAVATAALEQLFAGPTAAETAQGLGSSFSAKTVGLLRSVRVLNSVAYVDLSDLLRTELSNASTSCGSAIFGAQVERTLRQFPTISEVHFALDGDPAAYYEFMQVGCPRESSPGDRCDPSPFRPPAPGSGLEAATSYVTAAGACAEPSGPIVTVVVGGSPVPRCTLVRPNQRLRVQNDTAVRGDPGQAFTLSFASFPERTIQPGRATVFDRPFSELLAPGVHDVRPSLYRGSGFELVLRAS